MLDYRNLRLQEDRDLRNNGFVPLSGPYSGSEREQQMLTRVLVDARRANKEVAYSGSYSRVEVWQRNKTA